MTLSELYELDGDMLHPLRGSKSTLGIDDASPVAQCARTGQAINESRGTMLVRYVPCRDDAGAISGVRVEVE
jgi:hypothetical protein